MDVDEARRDRKTFGVDLDRSAIGGPAEDRADLSGEDHDVRFHSGRAGAVEDRSATNDDVRVGPRRENERRRADHPRQSARRRPNELPS
jgi:hypothetical protein